VRRCLPLVVGKVVAASIVVVAVAAVVVVVVVCGSSFSSAELVDPPNLTQFRSALHCAALSALNM